MDQLRFTGLHEDGAHLVLTDDEGVDYAVVIDERLRGALRRQRADAEAPRTPVTPRDVQAMVRAGQSAQEIHEVTGWELERVQRYETPILAERVNVAALARSAHVRTHDRSGPAPTLESRAVQRLGARGVDLERVQWDSTRPEGGHWSVVVSFIAGQRLRQASWRFDLAARALDALDDEARWLSEDEQSLPRDVTAATVFAGGGDGPDDLMSSMRERSRKRSRARRPRTGRAGTSGTSGTAGDSGSKTSGSKTSGGETHDIQTNDVEAGHDDPVSVPGRAGAPDEALPLEDFPYDPTTMGLPPSAHGHLDEQDATDDTGADDEQGEEQGDGPREATLADFFGDGDGDGEDAPTVQSEDAGYAVGGQDEGQDQDQQQLQQPEPGQDADPSSTRRRNRPSVPSWDDIMFGARDRGR